MLHRRYTDAMRRSSGRTPVALQTRSDTIGAAHVVRLTRLRLVRERRALTQQELAEKAGVHRITIARIETGVDEPRPPTTRKLAAALEVEPEDLMEPLN